MSTDEHSSPAVEPVESADLSTNYAAAQPLTPRPSENWGLESPPRLPSLPPRLIATLVAVLLVVVVSPFVFMRMKPTETTMKDDAFYALEAYSRALSSGATLETGLSPAERALVAVASRLETKDGPMLVLRGEFGCWGVSATALPDPAQPKSLDSQFCP
jgi:hypothetical protein